tara:strand:- start:7708 stop:8994 length:1287 start_codon:yes stop_codon:yes gene_type:complete
MKKAHIISIGNELLIGDTVNTNASWIGRSLTESGFEVERVFTIPDSYDLIRHHIKQSLEYSDFTVVTGGLGPTHDDITKKVVKDIFDCDLVEDSEVMDYIEKIFKSRGFHLSESNREQALVPSACDVLFNKQGTAPGMWFELNGNYLAVLPGVPYEMQYLMIHQVYPKLQSVFTNVDVWVTDYFKTAGIPESTLSDQIGSLDEFLTNGIGVAFLPNPGGVTIRISASGSSQNEAEQKLSNLRNLLESKIGHYLYGKGKELNLAEVVGELLKKNNLTIAIAESCTGGYISNEMTNIPGSSEYLNGGVVAYSNQSKAKMLGVDPESINKYGAVSKEVALQMAKGVAEQFDSTIGVSTTGIAGPGGGTEEKPVGLVWMGFWVQGKHFALKAMFSKDRKLNKERTSMVVLETVRRELLEIPNYPYELKPYLS